MLHWARADLAVPLRELRLASSLADTSQRPPKITIGPRENDSPTEDPDVIRSFVAWIGDELIGNKSQLHKTVFEAAFHDAQALDRALLAIAPRIDLRDTTSRAIYNARGGLSIATHSAIRRPGAQAGLAKLLRSVFELPTDPKMDAADLTVLVDSVPVDRLLDEYTEAVPAALDIAYPALRLGDGKEEVRLSNGTVAVLRRRIRALWAVGRPAGIYVDGSGEYGVCLLEDGVVAMLREPGDKGVIVRSTLPGGVIIHDLSSWAELADDPVERMDK